MSATRALAAVVLTLSSCGDSGGADDAEVRPAARTVSPAPAPLGEPDDEFGPTELRVTRGGVPASGVEVCWIWDRHLGIDAVNAGRSEVRNVTDARGSSAISALVGVQANVFVRAGGDDWRWAGFRITDRAAHSDPSDVLTFDLEGERPDRDLPVRVVDEEGSPVPGARVRELIHAFDAGPFPFLDTPPTDADGRTRVRTVNWKGDGCVLVLAPGRPPVQHWCAWVGWLEGRMYDLVVIKGRAVTVRCPVARPGEFVEVQYKMHPALIAYEYHYRLDANLEARIIVPFTKVWAGVRRRNEPLAQGGFEITEESNVLVVGED